MSALAQTEWPTTPVPQSIKQLLGSFFELGDSKSEDAARRLADEIFTPEGQIMVNKRTINGAKEISSSNRGLLSSLQSRQHRIAKVYTCNESADDLMLIGVVTWTFDDGQSLDGPFAARAVVQSTGGPGTPRLKLYQGWADMSELLAALAEPK
ncbi:hypothetical protein PV05_11950 [Exophiala xenobiotica]|uniref:SnoaL-like domain-containing protein n=1 Tax=Exophiala xenobiotica TaxID=348802 RepID=A0A0D2ERD2_9EURO|nr:uncharacterized protein PV05_11950 [Exophiala xenobiotica]KIW50354.1 hypothetical protein PV05_11950 [Exophiala xenobiotica]